MTLPFICLTLGLLFTTAFSVYAGFWQKVMYICLYTQVFGQNSCTYAYIHRFLDKSHVHTHIFGQKSHIDAGFWPKSAYTCRFLAKRRVYTQLFFKQSRTSSLLVSLMLWEVVGWVVSVVGSSLGRMLSVGCFFCDQRLIFHLFVFESSFSHLSFSFFH